jgi:hypothetical protein
MTAISGLMTTLDRKEPVVSQITLKIEKGFFLSLVLTKIIP